MPNLTADQLFPTSDLSVSNWDEGEYILRGHLDAETAQRTLDAAFGPTQYDPQKLITGAIKTTWTRFDAGEGDDFSWQNIGPLDPGALAITWVRTYVPGSKVQPDYGPPDVASAEVARLRSQGWFDDALPELAHT